MELEKSAQETERAKPPERAKPTERAKPFQVQTAAPSQIQPTGERAPSAGGGKGGKTGGGVVYNSSTSGTSNNKVNTMGFFCRRRLPLECQEVDLTNSGRLFD